MSKPGTPAADRELAHPGLHNFRAAVGCSNTKPIGSTFFINPAWWSGEIITNP